MPHPLRGLLFECVRELTMNALKYAGPCRIRVALSRRDGGLAIVVADNGKGFDPAAETRRDRPGGFGLFNERPHLGDVPNDIHSASRISAMIGSA